jgi:hypothetical protein
MRQLEARLLDGVRGRVVLPDDAGWDEARRSWNLSVDQRAAAVVERPASTGSLPCVGAAVRRA